MATKTKPEPIDLEDMTDIRTGAGSIFVSPKTVCNWLTQGKLSRFKVGGKTLISKKELRALIKRVA
jgi:hypothetical protein